MSEHIDTCVPCQRRAERFEAEHLSTPGYVGWMACAALIEAEEQDRYRRANRDADNILRVTKKMGRQDS